MKPTLLRALCSASLLALLPVSMLSFGTAASAAWPERAIRIVIPFPPGGTLDAVGRLLAQKLGEQTGQSVIVENRPGANGTIGPDQVLKADADGYTLLFSASTFTTAPMTMKAVSFDVERDFAPIALVAKAPLAVSVNNDLAVRGGVHGGVRDVPALMAYGRANPGKLAFAVGSIASAGHLATELLSEAGQMQHLIVPYKGTSPAFQDLIGGRIHGFIDPILGALPYHQADKLRIIATTGEARIASLPDVPTVGETVPGYAFYSWYGLWGKRGLPDDVVQRLNTEVNRALEGEMKDRFAAQGLLMTPGSVADFAAFQHAEMAMAKKIIDEKNLRVEQ